MKTKTIFKTLALAMMMPAMLLTTACSSDDDSIINNENINKQNTAKKGYALPVTVNVTRQGDAATRATYTDGGDTGSLAFGAGDKLFVEGQDNGVAGCFAGTLDYDAVSGKFSGTIYTENLYSGTADKLFTDASADFVQATLLPAGYEDHGYLVINTNDPDEQFEDFIEEINEYILATSKADGVAQFSYEKATTYSSGFALAPQNAILNFTITGLAASTSVNVSLKSMAYNITGTVTTDASGTATFAAGINDELNLQPFSLTVAGNPITIVSSDKYVDAGKIYNITRAAAPAATDLSTISEAYTASDGETLTGTLASNVKISIADGATVTLNNVTINGVNDSDYEWAGITCLGDATIILSGTNTVKGFDEDYPGIQAAAGKKLTINGTGSLTASSYDYAAAIGGGNGVACGNIEIQGGTITATSGGRYAGIGGGNNAACGNITISGGTVTATGGTNGAGIGGGYNASWGNITISGGTVTATGGDSGAGIGGGKRATASFSCGNITISGGTVHATGGADAAGIGGGRGNNNNFKSSCGTIEITTGVTEVNATKGNSNAQSIGAGRYGTCGTVTIEAGANVTQN